MYLIIIFYHQSRDFRTYNNFNYSKKRTHMLGRCRIILIWLPTYPYCTFCICRRVLLRLTFQWSIYISDIQAFGNMIFAQRRFVLWWGEDVRNQTPWHKILCPAIHKLIQISMEFFTFLWVLLTSSQDQSVYAFLILYLLFG
jgi:hypothetical protein